MLTTDSITFGKYKGTTLGHVLKDRGYCKWLVDQDWFKDDYEYLYNRINEYDPTTYFLINDQGDPDEFLDSYKYFNLVEMKDIALPLSDSEKTCYEYYLEMIQKLRMSIFLRMENDEANPYDIKAPTKWLQEFERSKGIPRAEFKEFLSTYELPNLPYIIERIKKEGGIQYLGAKSFLIAKARSVDQEEWWENVLKSKYGEQLSVQFKYCKCIFDFINITTNTIFECKLGMKDFSTDQYTKYKLTLDKYRIIYLIGKDAVIDMEKGIIYSTNVLYYQEYIKKIPALKDPSYLDELIINFRLELILDLAVLFGTDTHSHNQKETERWNDNSVVA